MGAVIGLGFLALIVVAYIAYGNWLESGMRPRTFTTTVPPERLREIFVRKVAHTGWKLVDDGNPMVAQSSLAAGIRQQISLQLGTNGDDRTVVRVGPRRWSRKGAVPTKAHTIRWRLNGFVEAVRREDRGIEVRMQELRGR